MSMSSSSLLTKQARKEINCLILLRGTFPWFLKRFSEGVYLLEGASNTKFTPKGGGGRLLDTRRLFESRCLLDHSRY